MLLPLLLNNLLTSGGGVTIEPGKGEIVYNGYAPSVSIPVIINTGVGSLVFIGYAPTVTPRGLNKVINREGRASRSITKRTKVRPGVRYVVHTTQTI